MKLVNKNESKFVYRNQAGEDFTLIEMCEVCTVPDKKSSRGRKSVPSGEA